jgi:ribulose-phosphate 3-epimerase
VTVQIAPSILSADFTRLGDEIRTVQAGGAHMIHVDVMDGHFVPNITIGPPVVRSIRDATELPLDVHLMISEADRFIPAFADSGANSITVHVEALKHLDRTVALIRSFGARVGVALNPATSLSEVEQVLDLVDMVLIMTVNPGFGGQKFIPYTIRKIRRLREMIDQGGLECVIEVDGGIDLGNMGDVLGAGASVIVAGSAIFKASDPAAMVQEMLEKAAVLGYDSKLV